MPASVKVLTGNFEWLTPPLIVGAAEDVLGGVIDCDPAAHMDEKHWVAKRNYTAFTNGLAQEWVGGVFLNPPYKRGLVGSYVDKLICEIVNGNTTRAVVLVNAATDTSWFQNLVAFSDIVGFTEQRIGFVNPETGKAARDTPMGQAIFGINVSPRLFRKAFDDRQDTRTMPSLYYMRPQSPALIIP